MKKQKLFRILPLLLALLLLTGCVAAPSSTTSGIKPSIPIIGNSSEATKPTAKKPGISANPKSDFICQYLPETVENADNLPVLQWICLETSRTHMGFYKYTKDAAVAINQALAEKGMPFRLQFVLYAPKDPLGAIGTALFAEETIQKALAESDLIYGTFTQELATQYLTNLTAHTAETANPSLAGAIPHEVYWKRGDVDGKVYGIPTTLIHPLGYGYSVDAKVLEDWNLTAEDFDKPYWEMDELFARIYQLNGNQPFLYDAVGNYGIYTDPTTGELTANGSTSVVSTGGKHMPGSFSAPIENHFQLINSCFALDLSNGIPTAVNYLETNFVQKSQSAMFRYRQKGYLTTANEATLVRHAYVYNNQLSYDKSVGCYLIPAEPVRLSVSGNSVSMIGIHNESPYEDEALMLLSLLANDKEFRDLMLFGIEGRDYARTESGSYEPIAQGNGRCYDMAFLLSYGELYGSAGETLVPAVDLAERTEIYQDALENSQTDLNITFDLSPVRAELNAVDAILKRNKQENIETDPPVQFAIFGNLTDEEYNQMLAEIKAAGGDKIVAELQRQLDTWLAENPDWNK